MSDISSSGPLAEWTNAEEDAAARRADAARDDGADARPMLTRGKTFAELYRSGELPWPEEPLIANGSPFEVVEDYFALLTDRADAMARNDTNGPRRLAGEIATAEKSIGSMDEWEKAHAFDGMLGGHRGTLERASDPMTVSGAERCTRNREATPEPTRFAGPAPYFRRGRACVQHLAPAITLAALGHGEFAASRSEDADQLFRAVEQTQMLMTSRTSSLGWRMRSSASFDV